MREPLRGQLVKTSNGEEDDLLGIVEENSYETKILAKELEYIQRKQVTIRYFISEVSLPKDKLDYELAKIATGLAEADYGMSYSEYTGYLWTDEKLNVGGHDLIKELKNNYGKFLHLEMEIK